MKIHKHVNYFGSENSSHIAFRRIHFMSNGNYRQKSVFVVKLNLTKNYYRPQTKFARVMFLPVSVCPQGGGSTWSSACWEIGQQAGGTHPTGMHSCYRPQRSCGQGYVLTRVCDSVNKGGVSGEPPLGTKENPPPGTKENPPPGPRRTPPPRPRRTPLGTRETPPSPRTRQTPPPEHCSIRSMSGRYASYWNAFLLQ